jgi:hypothetical protein
VAATASNREFTRRWRSAFERLRDESRRAVERTRTRGKFVLQRLVVPGEGVEPSRPTRGQLILSRRERTAQVSARPQRPAKRMIQRAFSHPRLRRSSVRHVAPKWPRTTTAIAESRSARYTSRCKRANALAPSKATKRSRVSVRTRRCRQLRPAARRRRPHARRMRQGAPSPSGARSPGSSPRA